MKQINIIAAVARNGVIGAANTLPWRLAEDLQRFKELTEGGTVIMGRKTWESLPIRPLKNRDNVVISRNTEYSAPGARLFSSLADAIATATTEKVWVIGGGELYKAALPIVDRLYLTQVNAEPEGDTYFPEIDHSEFELAQCRWWKDVMGTWHTFMDFTRVT